MKYIDIMFGPYEPDWGGLPRPEMPGYLVDSVNVRSTPNGYRSMPAFSNVTNGDTIGSSTTFGAAAVFYGDNPQHFYFVNDSGDVFESRDEGDSWSTVTPATGATLGATGDFVAMNGDVIYIDTSRAPVRKAFTDSAATLFSNLAGSPPIATCGARVHQHLVLGHLVGTDNMGVRWSAIGDHETWPTPGTADARSKQAGYESLNPEFGEVIAILGGEKIGIVVQQRAFTRMTYVGGSVVYNFDTYERVEGAGFGRTSHPVNDGRLWYLFNDSGVYATDGYSVSSVSEGKIDEAIFNNTLSHPNGGITSAFSSVYDPQRAMLMFSRNASSYSLCYNVSDGNFSWMNDSGVHTLFGGVSVPGLAGGNPVYNVSTSRVLQKFGSGTPTIAMQTGFMELEPGHNIQFQGAHLLGVATGNLTLEFKTADSSSACNFTQTGFTAAQAATLGQKVTGRATAQYIAFRVTGVAVARTLIRGIRVYYTVSQPAT